MPSVGTKKVGQSLSKWTEPCQHRNNGQLSSRENSPTCSTFGKQLWRLHFGSSIPLSRSENQGRAREAITPSQVQHCGQRARETVREGRARGLLFTLSRRSQFPAVSGLASLLLQAGGNPHTLYIPQVNQYFQPFTARTHFHFALTPDGQVAEH